MKNHNVLILIVAAMLPGAAPLAAQCQMAFNISVYTDGSVSGDLSTVYGYSDFIDNSQTCSCSHGNYQSAVAVYDPNGSEVAYLEEAGGSSATSAATDDPGTYNVYGAFYFACSCYGQIGGGGGGTGVPVVPTVTITSADVTQNNISLVLAGPGSGQLTLQLVGPSGTYTIRQVQRIAGTYNESFGITSLPSQEFTSVVATWSTAPQANYAYHIKVLGVYRQTQYNTPAEINCAGSPTPVTVFDSSCTPTTTSMISGFVSQVTSPTYGTGSGHSINYNDVSEEFYCATGTTVFRKNFTITGSLGPVNDSTVAVCRSSELYSTGTRVFIVGEGVKTVTDSCPKCCQDTTHLDNYTSNTACAGVGSLPNAMTIRLY